MNYILLWKKNNRVSPQYFSTKEIGTDAGDKLWHSMSKAEQDELDELCLLGADGEILKRWK